MTDTKPSVSFDRAADYYDETRGFPAGLDEAAVKLFLEAAPLGSNDSILEIGVGTGRIAVPFKRQFSGRYFGIDISSAMLNKLRSKPGASHVHVSIGDGTALPFPSRTFSAVIAVHIFHLIPAWRDVLKETARVLKPNGVLLHGWGQRITESELQKVWDETLSIEGELNTWYADEHSTFLIEENWMPVGEAHVFTFDEYKTPRGFLDGLINRRWSRLWQLSDDEINTGIRVIEDYVRQHQIDLDAPRPIQQKFRVQAYRPPQAVSP